MKYLIVSLMLLGCTGSNTRTNRELFDDFHTSYAKGDFKKMNKILADDFTFIANGKTSSLKAEYVKYMEDWNKTFDTKWNVVSVQEVGGKIQSIEYDTDIYNVFFYGGKMRYRYTYSFKNNRIQSLKADTFPGAKNLTNTSENRFLSFYKWVNKNFPDKVQHLRLSDKNSATIQKELLENYLFQSKSPERDSP